MSPWTQSPSNGRVALVAGATRGAGRGIAVELGAAGATVYCTGRSTRAGRSPMDRPETIDETAELVTAAGGTGIAMRVDHARADDVAALAARIDADARRARRPRQRRLGRRRADHLGHAVLGARPAGRPRRAPTPSTPTSSRAARRAAAAPPPGRLLVEVTDGNDDRYRGNLFYDLAKDGTIRLARAEAAELAPSAVTVIALTPGFLRSEAMLDHFGVTAETWRDGIARDRHFAASETPRFVGRAVAALAADPDRARWHGQALSSWRLARTYGFTDLDGSTPDWGAHYAEHVIG